MANEVNETRQKLLSRLVHWRNRANGYASGIKDWNGFKIEGVHIKDVDLSLLSDDKLLQLLEDVVANFEYLSHQ